jgi:hypothetical protein
MSRMKLTINNVDHHRNGVHGNGFHVVSFTHPNGMPMVGIVFDNQPGNVAVLDVDLLSKGVIGDPNKWRGDEFADQLRDAVEEYETDRVKFRKVIPVIPAGEQLVTVPRRAVWLLNNLITETLDHNGYSEDGDGTITLPKGDLDALSQLAAGHPCDHGIHVESMEMIEQYQAQSKGG